MLKRRLRTFIITVVNVVVGAYLRADFHATKELANVV